MDKCIEMKGSYNSLNKPLDVVSLVTGIKHGMRYSYFMWLGIIIYTTMTVKLVKTWEDGTMCFYDTHDRRVVFHKDKIEHITFRGERRRLNAEQRPVRVCAIDIDVWIDGELITGCFDFDKDIIVPFLMLLPEQDSAKQILLKYVL